VQPGLRDRHQALLRLMRAQDWKSAGIAVRQLLDEHPSYAAGWCEAARIALALGNPTDALAAAAEAQRHAGSNPELQDAIGTLFSRAGDQPRALGAFDAAVSVAPDNAHYLFNRAAVRRFLGQLSEAEQDYDRVLELRPADFEAHRNRSDLRAQSAERNHLGSLTAALGAVGADRRGEVQLRYALAKEYEDLGEYRKSFAQLAAGARRQRELLGYDVAIDVATVEWIMHAYPDAGSTKDGAPDAPIFIVGLPRSGTTLVERILASHSSVYAAGELNHFALCLVDAVRAAHGGAPLPRAELVARSASIDFAALGRAYLGRVASLGFAQARFTDKMPLNYLYCGLIRRALPQARIVHVTRHPLAVCYAMYKNLFEGAYPFSYDLGEIGRYYLAYRRLMAHWCKIMPEGIHEISYERLVSDQLGETRRLLEFCGLSWEDACVDFHQNPAATMTASAAQVRRPIYDTSIAQWRHYEAELAGLRRQLESAGVDMSR
jgi:tetratricopeptide (TPR) repeat protein